VLAAGRSPRQCRLNSAVKLWDFQCVAGCFWGNWLNRESRHRSADV